MEKIKEFWEENKIFSCITVAILIAACVMGGYILKKDSLSKSNEILSPDISSSVKNTSLSSAQEKTSTAFFVDIKGAVKEPGIYKATHKMRVADIVSAAGGFEKTADRNQVNLALKLVDQQVVYIPFKGEIDRKPPTTMESGVSGQLGNSNAETEAGLTSTMSAQGDDGQSNSKMDLNKVTKEELLELDGIGDKKADLILTYRTQHERFNKIEELKNISGIGDKTFEKLNERLMIGP